MNEEAGKGILVTTSGYPSDDGYVATAELNGVEPLAWLTDVVERLVSGRTKAHELERLLP